MVDNASILRKSTGFKQSERDPSQMFKGIYNRFNLKRLRPPYFEVKAMSKKKNPNQLSFLDFLESHIPASRGNGNGVVHEALPSTAVDVDIDRLDRFRGIDALVGRYRKMSREYENSLVERAQNGCLRARDRLICQNLGFIISTLNKTFPSMDYRELLGGACLGMDEAIKKFDVSRGLRLISYAVHWVKQRGYKQMSELKVIRDPQHYWLYKEQIKKRMVEKGETWDEAGEAIGISPRVLRSLKQSHLSLDKEIGEEGEGRTLADVLSDPAAELPDYEVERMELQERVREVVNTLTGRELDVIRKRFGMYGQHPWTLEQLGNHYDLTRERIRQIERKALLTLTKRFAQRGIEPSLFL